MYGDTLRQWLQFGSRLSVPNLKRHTVQLSNRYFQQEGSDQLGTLERYNWRIQGVFGVNAPPQVLKSAKICTFPVIKRNPSNFC